MKYDVFISCKSEDYNIGRQVYDFLTNYRGLDISVFMADKELRKRGNTDYGKIIDEALDSSTHLIIVSSNADFLKEEISSYVYEEWHTFVEEIRSGRKKGNIMTVFTENVKLEEVPIALRNRQSFPFTEYSPIVNYLKISDDYLEGLKWLIQELEKVEKMYVVCYRHGHFFFAGNFRCSVYTAWRIKCVVQRAD